jgi:hypothetical protein
MLKSILISILFLNYFVFSFNSDDICTKTLECVGNSCGLSSCSSERFGFECGKSECAINAEICDEYLQGFKKKPKSLRSIMKRSSRKYTIKECSEFD